MRLMSVLVILLIWSPVSFAQETQSLPEREAIDPVSTEIMADQQELAEPESPSENLLPITSKEPESVNLEQDLETPKVPPQVQAQLRQDIQSTGVSRTNSPFYVSVQTGGLNYPQVINIPTLNAAAGIAVGAGLGSSWSLEGGFIYSFQQQDIRQVSQTFIEDIDQFLFSSQLKYHWRVIPGVEWFTLSPGVIAAYNRRVYNGGQNESDAFDMGVSASMDVRLGKIFSLGVEYRYMANVDYQRLNAVAPSAAAIQQFVTGNPSINLEEAQYQIFMLQLKAAF